ncbi:uncharacterized protein F5147DRAFT_781510 [Suillus discolor]|uniref:Uncharacterized protein n=1 Tax=Suillus discolor TaxID=1912936 RepID=A0A9P7ERL5_9AGAM|nr:uncharacterized protein F5147DRAFT_781510 [Suillus discolor]KAG2086814.1 hypothetical protein F5147DRAFT_781510 [Suillus discolor]
MTVPPEQANQALNITLATLQSLMKRCIKVKEGDPEALRLSDGIARCVAKDLKMYGGNTTSFSPQLLSFAAVVRENSKGSTFESVPDWTSITDNDPCIKSHPRFDKTVDYLPPSLNDLVIATATTNPPTTITTPTTVVPPSTQAALPSMPSLMESDILAGPEAETNGSSGLWKGDAEDPPIPIDTPASLPAKYNLFVASTKKRKLVVEDTDAAVAVAQNKLPSPSEEPVKKRKKVESQPITKPAVWGLDSDIVTPWKHSVRYHPWQCDKCAKLDIACIVLPDKKFGYTRLACKNCDSMKISCAIDGVGVRQRLQVKAVKASSDLPQQSKPSNIVQHEEKKPNVLLGRVQSPAPTNLLEPEPTAREILQGIQDLGK